MIALYDFIPLYCPSCGNPTRLDRADNMLSGKYKAHQALRCPSCQMIYQLTDKTDLLRAATASRGDLIGYFIEEDDSTKPGNGKG